MASEYRDTETVIDEKGAWRPFILEYPFDGGKCMVEVWARSWQEAEQRRLAIGQGGHIEGEIQGTMDAEPE